jgi:hypothetical protein
MAFGSEGLPYNSNNGVTGHDIAQSVGAYKVILI